MRKASFIALLTAALAMLSTGAMQARTFYLSTSGDDSAEPVAGAVFRTLHGAVQHLWGGDTLVVRPGTYAGGVVVRRGCSEDAPLVIMGEGPYSVIRGSGNRPDVISLNDCYHVVLDNIHLTEGARAGIVLDHCKYITVRNCTSFNNGRWGIFTDHASDFVLENNECWGSQDEHGIYHSNSGDDFIIRGNFLHHNSGCGIHINGDPEYGGDGVISRGIIEKNICFRNGRPKGGAGINMTHVQDVIVRNNLIYHNFAGGITFYQDTGTFRQGSKRALIMNNTVVFRPGEGRTGVNIMPTSEKALICGNILVSGGGRGAMEINSDYLPTVVTDYNVLWGIDESEIIERVDERRISFSQWKELSGNSGHTVIARPRFAAPGYGDFHLGDSSPAVGAAMPLEDVRRALERLGGYGWHLEKLSELPDDDLEGRPRAGGDRRSAGAFAAE